MDTTTQQIDVLNAAAWAKRNVQVEATLVESQQTYDLAEKVHYLRGMADSLRNQAEALRQMDRSREALPLGQRAIKFYEQLGDERNRLVVIITLSAIYDRLGNAPMALQYGLDGKRILRQVDDPALAAKLYNILGFIHDEMQDFAQAIEHYQQALDYLEGGADPSLMGKVLNNLAWTFVEQARFDDALPLAERGYQMLVDQGAVLDQPAVLHTIGCIHKAAGNLERALDCFDQVLKHEEIDHDSESAIVCLTDMSRIYRAQGDIDNSLTYLEQAWTLADQEAAVAYLPEIYAEYADLYEAKEDFANALKHHRLFHQYHTAQFNEQSDQRMQDLVVMHEVETARLESLAQFQKNQALELEIVQNERMIDDLESYAGTVAHDLKNPIGLLQMYAYLLQTDLEGRLEPANMEAIEGIAATTEKMLHIVEGLLTLAQTRRDQVLAQPLDMNQIVNEAQNRLQETIERSGAQVHIQPNLISALGHVDWVEAVWVNYLSNAIKYGGQPPQVFISSHLLPDGLVQYRVEDNGAGIKPEQRQQVFQKFERLGRRTIEGHGLGLSIVKTVVEKLAGQVGIEDRPDGQSGSCFTFTLPAIPEQDSVSLAEVRSQV